MILLSMALAMELGANAPESLKPCPAPKKTEKMASPTDPNYKYLTHIRRLKDTCGEITGLLDSVFPSIPVTYEESVPNERTQSTNDTPVVPSNPEVTFACGCDSNSFYGAGNYYDYGGYYFVGTPVYVFQPIPVSPVPELPVWGYFSICFAVLGVKEWKTKRKFLI